jgi:peptidoglycan lytic transglycosylase
MSRAACRILLTLAACAIAAPSADASTGGTAAPTASDSALTATPNVIRGRYARFHGDLSARAAGKHVAIERYDELSRQWVMIARRKVGSKGGYRARWRADVPGVLRTRARLTDAARAAAVGTAEATVTVFRPGLASWYGPGFWGNHTACGQILRHRTRGVAHPNLPCGTEVALTYRGRVVTVPVIDRGPFAHGRRWDLTRAVKRALHFPDVGTVGALPVGD